MVYGGRVVNGTIVLDDPVELPEGSAVTIQVVPTQEPLHPDVVRFSGTLPAGLEVRTVYAQRFTEQRACE